MSAPSEAGREANCQLNLSAVRTTHESSGAFRSGPAPGKNHYLLKLDFSGFLKSAMR
jgi:hypothetical protein